LHQRAQSRRKSTIPARELGECIYDELADIGIGRNVALTAFGTKNAGEMRAAVEALRRMSAD